MPLFHNDTTTEPHDESLVNTDPTRRAAPGKEEPAVLTVWRDEKGFFTFLPFLVVVEATNRVLIVRGSF